jgi:hypothetical protein
MLRDPGLALPVIALVVNILLIAFLVVELRSARKNMRVAFVSQPAVAARAKEVTRLDIGPGAALSLNGEAVKSMDDLEFRLAGKGAAARGVVIAVGSDVTASQLTRVLALCSRAGLTDVALQERPGGPSPEPAQP